MSEDITTIIGYTSRWAPVALHKKELPAKKLGPTQVRIALSHIALNPVDLKLQGLAIVPHKYYQVGHDIAGTIVEAGSAVADEWKPGDRICAATVSTTEGIVGSTTILDTTKHAMIHPPSSLNNAEAAGFPVVFGTAYGMLEKTSRSGRLLVLGGATSVGVQAIQLAKRHFKFSEVYATCSAASSEYVKSFGADHTIDYHAGDLGEQLKGLGVEFDAIADAVGGYDAIRVWPDILKPAKDGGSFITVAGDVPPGDTYTSGHFWDVLKSSPWMLGRIFFGKLFSGINYQFVVLESGDWTKVAPEFFSNPQNRVPIDSVYPLADYKRAWDKLNSTKARGKIVLEIN